MRAAFAFLTPVGGARTPTPRSLPWFGVVGATIGATTGVAWSAATDLWTPAVGAAVAVVTNLALTGMLHVDGLGDSADGLLPHLPVDRRLAVMRQPDIGAYGVAAIGGVLLLQFAALSSSAPDWLLLAGVWSATRAGAAVVVATRTYARHEGLATAFRGPSPATLVIAIVALAGCAVVDVAAATATIVAFVGVIAFAQRRIGGYTGDVLGAAIVVAETAALLAAAA